MRQNRKKLVGNAKIRILFRVSLKISLLNSFIFIQIRKLFHSFSAFISPKILHLYLFIVHEQRLRNESRFPGIFINIFALLYA